MEKIGQINLNMLYYKRRVIPTPHSQRRSAMADQHPQRIPERLLQAAITSSVSQELGVILRKLGDFTKTMTEADAKEAKLMVLEMVRTASGEFYTKMKSRIEADKKDQSE